MGQNAATVDVDLVLDLDVITQHRDVLGAGPGADSGAPANNGLAHVGVRLDGRTLHDYRARNAGTVAHSDIRANNDRRAELGRGAHLRRRVDQHVANVFLGVGKCLWLALSERVEVESSAREEVLGLADIHPVTLKVV